MSYSAEEQNNLRLDSRKGSLLPEKDNLDQLETRELENFSAGKLKYLCVKADATQGVGAGVAAGHIVKVAGLGTGGCWVSEENRVKFRITNQVARMKSLIELSPLYKNQYVQFSNETATTIDVLILGIDSSFFYEGNNNCLVKEEIWLNKDKIDTLGTSFSSHATVTNWIMSFAIYNNRLQSSECEGMCSEVWFTPPADTSPTKSYVMQIDPDFRYIESGKLPKFYTSQYQAITHDDPLSFRHQPGDVQAQNYNQYIDGVSHQFTVASGQSKRFDTEGKLLGADHCICESFDSSSDSLLIRFTYRVTGHSVDTSTTPPTTGHLDESSYKVPCSSFPHVNKVIIS